MFTSAFVFLVFVKNAVTQFECPMFPIKDNKGYIPASGRRVQVPAGTNCLIDFPTPTYSVLKLSITADGVNGSDSVTVTNTINKVEQALNMQFGYVIYLHSGSGVSFLNISSPLGTLEFIAEYEVSKINHEQTLFLTGDGKGFSLYDLRDTYISTNKYGHYITMKSTSLTDVAISIDTMAKKLEYSAAKYIYVYNGSDIYKSEFLGRLIDLVDNNNMIYTSRSSISFVCFYVGTTKMEDIYILGNDKKDVVGFSKYSVIRVDNNDAIGQLFDNSADGSVHTFIAIGSSTMFLSDLQFEKASGNVVLQGGTPTQNFPKLIKYDGETFDNSYLPQIIKTSVFTLYKNKCDVSYNVSLDSKDWLKLVPNRRGYFIQPKKWGRYSADYEYIFQDKTQFLNVELDFSESSFIKDYEYLKVQIAEANVPCLNATSPNGQCIDVEYNSKNPTTEILSINGNYLRVALRSSSSDGSNITIAFRFSNDTEPKTTVSTSSTKTTVTPTTKPVTVLLTTVPTTVTKSTNRVTRDTPKIVTATTKVAVAAEPTSVTTTITPVETTTKSSATISIFVIFIISFVKQFLINYDQ